MKVVIDVPDIVRVVRVVEYIGPADVVDACLKEELSNGEWLVGGCLAVRVATLEER